MKNKSLFSPGNIIHPFIVIDRFLNPFNQHTVIDLDNKSCTISCTRRASLALELLQQPLIVEMQLYFSCVVKKRVLIHHGTQVFQTSPVADKFSIAFHTVEAASCDPEEFARHFPAKRILDSEAARKMHPRVLKLDFKQGEWQGEFQI